MTRIETAAEKNDCYTDESRRGFEIGFRYAITMLENINDMYGNSMAKYLADTLLEPPRPDSR